MFKNFIKTALRSLVKDKYYSAINILGLAVGLTVTILIILYVYDELTYDNYHVKHDRIYRLESNFTLDNKLNHFAVTMVPLGPTLMDEYPEIGDIIDELVKTFPGGGQDATSAYISEGQQVWQSLNAEVDIDKMEPDEVARQYLLDKGLISE